MDCLQGQREARRDAQSVDKGGGKDKIDVEVLPITKLRFSMGQLTALNYRLTQNLTVGVETGEGCSRESKAELKLAEESEKVQASQADSIVERLIQRLLCAVGNLDPRFANQFLISLHDSNLNMDRTNLEYIVRLDALSTPVLYPSDQAPCCEILEFESASAGFARIRLRNKTSTNWAEFINSSGYLRRDKVQERYVELLALAAAGGWPASPIDCDEGTQCAAPGKVVDAATLSRILETAPEDRVFYGVAPNNLRFPDPRDFRLAIVDEPAGIRVRVGFLSPSLAGRDVEVRLIIAIGVDCWPSITNFPARVPLGHPNCLLYNRCADLGIYLCAIGTQSATWQIQLPASEVALLNHYGLKSTETVVLKILYRILDEIHSRISTDTCKYSCKLLTRRMMREVLWSTLEENSSNPLSVMLEWTSGNTSKHVLRLLDKLVGSLRCQSHPSYFFPNCNLLENSAHAQEEDYLVEANRIYMHMVRLHDTTLQQIDHPDYIKMCKFSELDSALVSRWRDVIAGLLPPSATRSSRFSFTSSGISTISERRNRETRVAYSQYTLKQLEYIGMLLKSMLDIKQKIVQGGSSGPEEELFPVPEDPIEDVIYLLVTIIEQARDHSVNHSKAAKSSRYHTKTRSQFDAATAKLVDAVRKDRKRQQSDPTAIDFMEDSLLVKTVLRWLYKGLDQSKHSIGPILRPYLNKLFTSSHEISYHLDLFREKRAEIDSLASFSRLVSTSDISPATALIEAVSKEHEWASSMLRLVERSALRVIFIPDRETTHRHVMSLPAGEKIMDGSRTLQGMVKKRWEANGSGHKTLPTRRFQTFFENGSTTLTLPSRAVPQQSNSIPVPLSHDELKAASPMTAAFRAVPVCGRHPCPDDLVHTLAALNKIAPLQELAHILPPEDRQDMLETVHRLSRDNKRNASLRRRCTLPPLRSTSTTFSNLSGHIIPLPLPKHLSKRSKKAMFPQKYTPIDEDANFLKRNIHSLNINLNESHKKKLEVEDNEEELELEVEGDVQHRIKTQKVLKEREKALTRKIAKDSLIGTCRAARIREDSRVIFHENFKVRSLFKIENAL